MTYHVVHSWQLDEFKRALVDSHDKTTPLFEACAALFYDEYGIHKTTFVDEETCQVDEAGDAAPKKENGTDADEVPDSEMPDTDDGGKSTANDETLSKEESNNDKLIMNVSPDNDDEQQQVVQDEENETSWERRNF